MRWKNLPPDRTNHDVPPMTMQSVLELLIENIRNEARGLQDHRPRLARFLEHLAFTATVQKMIAIFQAEGKEVIDEEEEHRIAQELDRLKFPVADHIQPTKEEEQIIKTAISPKIKWQD
jgi:flagellin-specific chaperone FliS